MISRTFCIIQKQSCYRLTTFHRTYLTLGESRFGTRGSCHPHERKDPFLKMFSTSILLFGLPTRHSTSVFSLQPSVAYHPESSEDLSFGQPVLISTGYDWRLMHRCKARATLGILVSAGAMSMPPVLWSFSARSIFCH